MDIVTNRTIATIPSPPSPRKFGVRGMPIIVRTAGGLNCRTFTNIIIMRDRSKNRKPLQRGRISLEAISTSQALIRGSKKGDSQSVQQVIDSNFKRLLKFDMLAVIRELIRQNECLLALQVFEDIRKEHWYKPHLLLYADFISVLISNGLLDELKVLLVTLKMEPNLEPDIQGFNLLLTNLLTPDVPIEFAMQCYSLIKQSGCEPNRESFQILMNALESRCEKDFSVFVREEACIYFGDSFEFFHGKEQLTRS